MRNWAVLWLAVGMVCWGLGLLGGLGFLVVLLLAVRVLWRMVFQLT